MGGAPRCPLGSRCSAAETTPAQQLPALHVSRALHSHHELVSPAAPPSSKTPRQTYRKKVDGLEQVQGKGSPAVQAILS